MLLILETARCICNFEFLSCLSFLTENSNTIIITAFAQNCNGLDSDQSFGVSVTAWLRWVKCQVNAFFHYISFIMLVNS